MVGKRKPKLTLNTAIVRKNTSTLKINPNLNSAVSLARDERINSSRNILTVLEGGKTYSKPIKILPNLYLGSCDATKDLSTLLDKDITTILNLAAEVEKPNWFNSDHWMDLSNNHWVTKITQSQLEAMSSSSEASSNATKVNPEYPSPPSPPPSDNEDSKKKNNIIQEQATIFPLSPLPKKSYPSLQKLYTSPDTIPNTPLSPSSPSTPTSVSGSSQHTLVLSPVETSFDSVSSSNTISTPFVDTYTYPPETPYMDTNSNPYPPETPYVDTIQTAGPLSTVPETPYFDTFSTPINTSSSQLPPETPYFETFNGTTPLPIPETPYVDAYSSQQQMYLAKLINNSQKSINDSDLLQALSLSSASTPPSATISTFNSGLVSSKLNNVSSLSIESKITDNKELEIHYYHQCWNHNQRNTQEKLLEAFNIIDSTRLGDQHSILVSCQQGVSRSATLVIAYVMKCKQWGLMKSYNFVKEKCPWIAPNISLMNELSEFEQRLLQQSQNQIQK